MGYFHKGKNRKKVKKGKGKKGARGGVGSGACRGGRVLREQAEAEVAAAEEFAEVIESLVNQVEKSNPSGEMPTEQKNMLETALGFLNGICKDLEDLPPNEGAEVAAGRGMP